MLNVFRVGVATILIIGSVNTTFAWSVIEDWRDPIGGRTYTVASEINDEGMSISIFRDSDERVRAVYSIPESSFDRLPREGRVLSLRPGQLAVTDIEAAIIGDGITQSARSEGRSIRAILWHGQDPSPTLGLLRDILDSDTLFARFYTDNGGTIDTSWSLEGAPEAIATAIGIKANARSEDIEWANLQTELIVSSTRRCEVGSGCLGKVIECVELLKTPEDVPAFNQCIERAAP